MLEVKGVVKWDTEELGTLITKLSEQRDNLNADATKLLTLKSDIEAAWQSVAGTGYVATIDVNYMDVKSLLDRLTSTIEAIEKVKSHYSNCDSDVRTKVGSMSINK